MDSMIQDNGTSQHGCFSLAFEDLWARVVRVDGAINQAEILSILSLCEV